MGSLRIEYYRSTLYQCLTTFLFIEGWARLQDQSVLQAFDVSLLAFARWSEADDNPTWIIHGSKAFRSDGTSYKMSPSFIARVGYNASLKCCISGLILTSEISVSCFLQGGRLVDFIAAIGNFKSPDDLARNCDDRYGLPRQLMQQLDELLKNCKIKTLHLGHTKKMKGFGKLLNNIKLLGWKIHLTSIPYFVFNRPTCYSFGLCFPSR